MAAIAAGASCSGDNSYDPSTYYDYDEKYDPDKQCYVKNKCTPQKSPKKEEKKYFKLVFRN